MRLSTLGFMLVLLLLFSSQTFAQRDAQDHFFDQSLGDFSEELDVAKEEGKKGILIMFELDDCPFCHRMKQTVLNQEKVQDYYKQHFLIYTVDIEGDVSMTDFQGNEVIEKDFAFKQHRVRATPVFGFFDLEGKMVTRFTGATNTPEEFMWLGEYVVDEQYKKTSFTKYKRQRKAASRGR